VSDRPLSERVWDSFDIPDEQFEYVAAEIAKLEQRLADACDQCAVMDGHVERLKQERDEAKDIGKNFALKYSRAVQERDRYRDALKEMVRDGCRCEQSEEIEPGERWTCRQVYPDDADEWCWSCLAYAALEGGEG